MSASWIAHADRHWRCWFRDEDGIEPIEPFAIDALAAEDMPPTIEKFAALDSSGAATPLAAAPFAATFRDDHGVRGAALRIDGPQGSSEFPFADPGATAPRTQTVDLAELGVKAGHTVRIVALASDVPGLPFGLPALAASWQRTRQTESAPVSLDIVTPEEFLARLAARELAWRQRFENVVREFGEARSGATTVAAGKLAATARRLRLEELPPLLRKDAAETRELAAAFASAAAEVRHNRLPNSTAADRLDRQVARPLRQLADETIPFRLAEAAACLASGAGAEADLALARGMATLAAAADAILRGMLKQESFNELAGALRSLRDDQAEVARRTREERKRRVLDLLK